MPHIPGTVYGSLNAPVYSELIISGKESVYLISSVGPMVPVVHMMLNSPTVAVAVR
jgi:hypothetical protein